MKPELVHLTLQLIVEMPPDGPEADDRADAIAEDVRLAADGVVGVMPGHTAVIDWTTVDHSREVSA